MRSTCIRFLKPLFSRLRIPLSILACVLAWHGLSIFCKKQTDGFSVMRVQSDLQDYEGGKMKISSPPSSEVLQIFSLPFHYLGRGGQSFVFVSEDDRYVLKLAKRRSYAFYNYLASLSLPPVLHKLASKRRDKAIEKINRDCSSYQIAYEEIPDLTGLLYAHLAPIPGRKFLVTLTDKIGISHKIDLNKVTFVLQKKGEPIGSYLSRIERTKNQTECRKALRAILNTLHTCVYRGIFDEDPGMHRNFGFVDGAPIFLDVGRFIRTEVVPFPPFEKTVDRLKLFLEKKHPQLLPLFYEELLHYVPKT